MNRVGTDALAQLEELVKGRRATRHFSAQPVERALLERLVACAQWAPSGYNLQPLNVVMVTRPERRAALLKACMDQQQVVEAPAVAVFCGMRDVFERHTEAVLAADKACGGIDDAYEAKLRGILPLAFKQGPLGVNWLWKALLPPFGRFVAPIPSIPAVEKRYWLGKQVALNAMVYMLAAHAAGLATVPMEGFDERRVKRTLGLARNLHVVLVVPTGYAAPGTRKRARLPVNEALIWD